MNELINKIHQVRAILTYNMVTNGDDKEITEAYEFQRSTVELILSMAYVTVTTPLSISYTLDTGQDTVGQLAELIELIENFKPTTKAEHKFRFAVGDLIQ
jgi:hypothetical protein